MKVWKKLAGVVLALAVMMCLGVSAMAADGELGNRTTLAKAGIGNEAPTTIDGTSFTVDLTNASDSTGLPRPEQAYTYAITGAGVTFDTTDTRYDAETDHVTVTFDADSGGAAAAQQSVRVVFDSSAEGVSFTTPTGYATKGMKYYYVDITQTAPGGGTTTYRLYVYVNGDNNAPYAAVMAPSETTWAVDMSTVKVSGFSNEFAASVKNVTLSKVLAGSMADPDLDFPFSVKIQLPTEYKIEGTVIDVTTANSPSSGTTFANHNLSAADVNAASFELSGYLKGGENVVFANLPVGTVVQVKETTDSALGYGITSEVDGAQNETEVRNAVDTEDAYVTSATVGASNNVTITYTNTLDAVSPTGVVLRFAPYIAMLGAGCCAMVIAPRRKEEE